MIQNLDQNGNIIYKDKNLEINYKDFFKLKCQFNCDSYSILEWIYKEKISKERGIKIQEIL